MKLGKTSGPHGGNLVGMIDEILYLCGEGRGRKRGTKKPVDSIINHLRHGAKTAGDYGAPVGPSFKESQRKGLVPNRGHYAKRSMGPKSPLILSTHKPGELNRQKAKLSGKSFQPRLFLSGASDYELSATRPYQLPSAEKNIDPFFWGEPSEEKNVAVWAGGRRRFFWFIEVRNDMNSFLRDSHLHMLGSLSFAQSNPNGHILKSTDGADTP